MAYREAWAIQEAAHAEVLAGGEERIFLVEHDPVITFGRRPGGERNVLASAERLAKLGVEVVQSDRGGDITFHGPGQVVAYPIIRLNDRRFSVGAYVHGLEASVIATLKHFGVEAHADRSAVGIWTNDGGTDAKVCAIGVRIKRGVSLHGVALNVETDLRYFELIVPCGLTGRPVTSLRKLLGDLSPRVDRVKEVLAGGLADWLTHPSQAAAAAAPRNI
jgi:lipoate-protein ligase B